MIIMDSSASCSDLESLPQIARQAVSDSLSGKQAASIRAEGSLNQSRGLFVTIHNLDRSLRGCRGTISATYGDLIEEVRHNAYAAAFHDPRFPAVNMDELTDLQFEVSILGDVEAVQSRSDLNPETYGIIITSLDGKKRGLMLPGVPHLDTVSSQVSATCEKAGIAEDEPIELERFRVDKFCE